MAKYIFNGKVYGITDPASTTEAGLVKTDGVTNEVDSEGVLRIIGEFTKPIIMAYGVYDSDITYNWEADSYYVVTNSNTINDGKIYYCETAAVKVFEKYNDEYDEVIDADISQADPNDYPYGTIIHDTVSGDMYVVSVSTNASIVEVTDNVNLRDIVISKSLYEGTNFELKSSKKIHFWIS